MKTFLLSATYLVGLGELFLAWYFWKTNSRNEIRKVMSIFSLALAVWVLSSAFSSYRSPGSLDEVLTQVIFISGFLIVSTLFHISLIFPFPLVRIENITRLLLYFPVLIITYILLVAPSTIIEGTTGSPDEPGWITPGPLYSIYNNLVLFFFLISTIILFSRLRISGGIHHRLLKLFAFSVLLGGLPAVIIDLIIPIYFSGFIPNTLVANLATGFWLGVTSFVVFRKA